MVLRTKLFFRLAAFLGLGAAVGLSLVTTACGSSSSQKTSASVLQLQYGPNPTFTYDLVSRASLTGWEVWQSSLPKPSFEIDYSINGVAKKVQNLLRQAGDEKTYSGHLANFVQRILTAAYLTNVRAVLAWEDPSVTAISTIGGNALVYLEGGPIGDVCLQSVYGVSSSDSYARDFYIYQGQFGFVPSAVVRSAGTDPDKNGYFASVTTSNHDQLLEKKRRFVENKLTNTEYLQLLGGDFTVSAEYTFLASSLAFSILTADRTAELIETLGKFYYNVYLVGESYGMHAGLEVLLQHPYVLGLLKGAELGRNVLAPRALKPKQKPADDLSSLPASITVGDPVLHASVRSFGEKYGYIGRLTRALAGQDGFSKAFAERLRDKVEAHSPCSCRTVAF